MIPFWYQKSRNAGTSCIDKHQLEKHSLDGLNLILKQSTRGLRFYSQSCLIAGRHLPFRLGVDFDNNELDTIVAASMATLLEQQGSPSGFLGFKLTYFQVAC